MNRKRKESKEVKAPREKKPKIEESEQRLVQRELKNQPIIPPLEPLYDTQIRNHLKEGKTVLRGVYTIPKIKLSVAEWTVHRDNLTIHPKPDPFRARQRFYRPPPPWQLWGEDSESYCVPPQYGLQHFGTPDVDLRPQGNEICVELKGNLWGEADQFDQTIPMQLVTSHLETTQSGGLLDMPTSSGKTYQMQHIFAKILKKKTLIISPTVALHNQLRARLRQFLPEARVGEIHQDIFDVQDKDIVIGMLHTLALRKDIDWQALNDIGCVMWDEFDKMLSKCLSRALYRLSHIRIHLGLSATCAKKDGMEALCPLFMGPFIYRAPANTRDSQQTNVQCVVYREGSSEVLFRPPPKFARPDDEPTIDNAAMMKVLLEDANRHDGVLDVLDELLKQDRNILAFVERVEYGMKLVADMKARHPDLKIVYFARTLNDLARQEMDQLPHRLIVATYHIASTGLDYGYIDTLFLVTPRRTVMQCVGRIRSFSKWVRKSPLILDVVDSNLSVFRGQHAARRKVYRMKKFKYLAETELVGPRSSPIGPPPSIKNYLLHVKS